MRRNRSHFATTPRYRRTPVKGEQDYVMTTFNYIKKKSYRNSWRHTSHIRGHVHVTTCKICDVMGLKIFRHYELRARSKKDVMARARDGGILSLDLVLASCSFLLRNVVSHLYTVLSNAFFMCVIMFVANIWSSFVFEFRSHSNSSRSTRRNSTVLRLTLVVGSGEFILVHRHSQTFLEKFHSAGMQREVHSVIFETVEV